ncbi:hypothetical protein CR513_24815, partial [Mucuna pruriens]
MQTAYIIENKLKYKVRNSEFLENPPSTMITLEGRRWCTTDGQMLRFPSTRVHRLYRAITSDSFQLPKSYFVYHRASLERLQSLTHNQICILVEVILATEVGLAKKASLVGTTSSGSRRFNLVGTLLPTANTSSQAGPSAGTGPHAQQD